MTCKAIRVNDQYQCGQCGLSWDLDDEHPGCRVTVRRKRPRIDPERSRRLFRELREVMQSK